MQYRPLHKGALQHRPLYFTPPVTQVRTAASPFILQSFKIATPSTLSASRGLLTRDAAPPCPPCPPFLLTLRVTDSMDCGRTQTVAADSMDYGRASSTSHSILYLQATLSSLRLQATLCSNPPRALERADSDRPDLLSGRILKSHVFEGHVPLHLGQLDRSGPAHLGPSIQQLEYLGPCQRTLSNRSARVTRGGEAQLSRHGSGQMVKSNLMRSRVAF